jgi:hypothetical protein
MCQQLDASSYTLQRGTTGAEPQECRSPFLACHVMDFVQAGAGAGAGASAGGNETERSSSRELASPRKCDRMVFAEACAWVTKGKIQ